VLFQAGTGKTAKLGINTITPASTLDVKGAATIRGLFSLPAGGTATATKGFNSQGEGLTASAFNSGTSKAVTQNFQWQAEPVGNNTSAASGSLNLLFGQGANKLAETALNIASNGQITFATGQTFPAAGDGTITGVMTAAGCGLIGGGSSGMLNLSLMDTCGSKQVLQWSGSAWPCASAGAGTVTSVGSGAGLTGGPITGSGTLSIATASLNWFLNASSFLGTKSGPAAESLRVGFPSARLAGMFPRPCWP
jgi:trimeric autotransporter adhesin